MEDIIIDYGVSNFPVLVVVVLAGWMVAAK